jgi:pimeloyl-[acyl-carrier protein] methyl ester esterase
MGAGDTSAHRTRGRGPVAHIVVGRAFGRRRGCVAGSPCRMHAIADLHIETAGAGPPLVLLHGWAMHGGLFAPVVPALATQYRVSVVDLPGHGYSAPVMPCTLDAIVSAIAEQFDAADEPVTILGWSLGGTIAMRWARLHPQHVARLLLVNATPRFTASDNWPHAMAPSTLTMFGDELTVSYRLTLQRFLSLQVQGSDEGLATLAALRGQLFARGEPARATLNAVLDVLAETDLRADACSIAAPTLIVTGERDALVPRAAGAWLARTIPGARHVDIAGAAHAPFLSHPRAFTAAIKEFLDAR